MKVLFIAAWLIGVLLILAAYFLFAPQVRATCEPTTGCEGIASHYGPGDGVAMNFCTWTLRHTQGCGSVTVTSLETGLSTIAPVIDYCECYSGTPDERIIDLQYGVVAALGLPLEQGLYPVRVEPAPLSLPNTAMR